ncbi:hypothetical protein CRENBAI_014851 [Crenichthys baileyi]|uniref:Uncharacterized protein n=1 Tax=Crenichthys baileyi TaxID=28760 RepID=A0AAV9SPZ2_9TELE
MGPQRGKTLAALQWRTCTPRPSMCGNVMELAEGGVRGWGAPLPSPPPEVATDLQQKGASLKRPSGQECGNQNMPHKGGPMTSTPSHPRTQGAQPTDRPVPDAGHQTTATTRQAGQYKQHPSLNTEAGHQARPDHKQQPNQKHKLQARIGTSTPPS